MAGGSNRALGLQIIDPVLTNVARQYRAHGFIYEQLVARQAVAQMTGQYPTFPKQYWYSEATNNEVKDRSPSREVDFTWSTEPFSVKEYALKVSITDLEREQANPALRLEQNKTDFLSLQMAIAKESRLATLLDDPAVVTGGGLTSGASTAATKKWDGTEGNPDSDIRAASLKVYEAIGYNPNVIVIPYPIAYYMATQHNTDSFGGRIQYSVTPQTALEGVTLLPNVIHGMKVIIPSGVQGTTANEGASSVTYTETWGKKVRLLYVEPGAGWGTPTCAYAFQHTGPTVTRWRQQDPDIDYIRQSERVIEKIVAPDAGWVIKEVIA
jgi:hypothetical protein